MKKFLGGLAALVFATSAFAQPPKPAYVSGSITTGALAKASGPQSFTTTDITGDCTTSGTVNLTCNLPVSHIASVAANTVIGNATGSSAHPTALTMTDCHGASDAVTWTAASGFGCNTLSGGSGTVTSVALSVPGFLSVSGSPVTTSGTLAVSLATESANTVFSGPTTGAAATPTFRSLVVADLPNNGANPSATASDTAVNGSATTFMRSDGAPAVQKGSSSQFGVVKVDGTTITATAGVISSTGGATGANPTATAGPTAVNGSASTYMRSDGAPAVQVGSNSQKGILQVDGSTIIASSGVISTTAGGGSSLVLLEAHTASTSASLVFTTAITSTYDDYVIELIDVLPASGTNNLFMRVSTNGGSSYDSATNYEWDTQYVASGATGHNAGNTSVAQIVVAGTNVSNATFGVNGTVKMFNPLSATLNKKFTMDITWFHDSLNTGIRVMGYGRYKSNTAVNALQFLMSSGNIASGTIRIYGVAH